MPLYCKKYNDCANLNIDLFLGLKEVILINIETIRNNPEKVKADLARRGDKSPIDDILSMDLNKRSLIHKTDNLRAKRNQISKELSVLKNKPTEIIEDMRNVGTEIKQLELEVKDIQIVHRVVRFHQFQLLFPLLRPIPIFQIFVHFLFQFPRQPLFRNLGHKALATFSRFGFSPFPLSPKYKERNAQSEFKVYSVKFLLFSMH